MATFAPRKGLGGQRAWQALIRRRGCPQQTRTFDTKEQAEAWAATIESEMVRAVFVSRTETENTTPGEAFNRYLTEIVARKHTKGEVRMRLSAGGQRSPWPAARWRACGGRR